MKIEVLFPSSENTTGRLDKRDAWYINTRLVLRVLKRWATPQKLLYGNVSVYTDLIEKLKTNMWGEVEVDDVLWIVMIQWAKLASVVVKKSKSRSEVVEANHLDAIYTEEAEEEPAPVEPAAPVPAGTLRKNKSIKFKPEAIAHLKLLPPLPISNLKSIVESIYRPGEGADLCDVQYFAANYLQRFGVQTVNRCVSSVPEANIGGHDTHFAKEMEHFLKDCVLWDLVNGFGAGSGAKKVVLPSIEPPSGAESKTPTHKGKHVPATTATATGAAAKAKAKQDSEPLGTITPYIFSQYKMVWSVNPELSLSYAKKIFASYQTPANLLITKVSVIWFSLFHVNIYLFRLLTILDLQKTLRFNANCKHCE